MRIVYVLLAVVGLIPGHAAADIRDCHAIRDGTAKEITFSVPTRTGQVATVKGIAQTAGSEAPVVIIQHSAQGLDAPDCYGWVQTALAQAGMGSVVLDTSSGWQLGNGRSQGGGMADMMADLQAVAAHLGAPERPVAIIGFSLGGRALLNALYGGWVYDLSVAAPPFVAAVSVYATCPSDMMDGGPELLLVHGDADVIAPIESCAQAVAQGRQMQVLAGARHLFDHPSSPNYNPADAERAMTRIVVFLRAEFDRQARRALE
ncbi:hypothetical protein ACMU_06820 [Actibacterium mucosum KCTC 23349]|uniref:Uncharacterized protein n=1 Tax=Actibacterium mucosum KCTC 23349 TaxID=1454373 RepID=A0A037ZJN4_9RHOB|nr:dienelactone hydrolase family protein [Actibacterium mucosum]KAJ56650.1 hypothetical protein ACMU_06820 [Actibacterium mucosum KCTC 23349]